MEEAVLQLRTIKSNIKPILMPILVISIVVILTIVSIPTVYGRITESLDQLDESNSKSDQLRQKMLSLRDIQNNILPQSSNTVLALPDKNPALYKYNVIRNNNDVFEDIRLNGFQTETLSNMETGVSTMVMNISYSEGSMDQMMNMLDRILQTIPYTTISSFSYNTEDGVNYSVGFAVHWSELPKTIAKISDPINALTSDEIETLSMISGLGKPEFVQLEQTSYPDRVSPFR